MDINDPRYRLTVAKATSPSLRVAAAPQQTLTLANSPANNNNGGLLKVVGADGSTPPPPSQQQQQQQNDPNTGNAILDGAVKLGKNLVSGLEQGAGDVADVAVQGGGLLGYTADMINPFKNDQQKQQALQQDAKTNESMRNWIHSQKDVNGNNIGGTSGSDQAAGNIAAGHGNVQDYATVAGQGLQTGLDATAFLNPGRVAGEAIVQPALVNAAKDIAGSSVGLGAAQGVASGLQNYGQTGDAAGAVGEGAKNGVIASLLQGGLGVLGHGFGALVNKASGTVNQITKSTDPVAISKIVSDLHPEMDPATVQEVAKYLANTKDKQTVQDILTNVGSAQEQIPVEHGIGNVEHGAEHAVENTVVDPNTGQPIPNPDTATVVPPDNGTALDRKRAADEAAAKEQAAADAAKQAQIDQQLASAKDPNSVDYPTFQAQKDLEAAATQHNEELNKLINENPDLTEQQIEALKQEYGQRIAKSLQDMQDARQKSMDMAENAPTAVGPNDKSVEQAAQIQSGTVPQTVDGTGQTLSDAVRGDYPDQVGEPSAQAAHASEAGSVQVGEKPKTDNTVQDVANQPTGPAENPDIVQLTKALEDAQTAVNDKTAGVSKEKAQRIAAANAAYEAAGGGEAGVRAKLAELRGAYQESDYSPIAVDTEVQSRFLDQIHQDPNLQEFEKLNTQNALRKVWGTNPEAPRQSDINYIRRFFNDNYGDGTGDEIAKGIQEAVDAGQTPQDLLANIAGLPRALMATGDLSGGFRQALPLGTRFPKMWANANAESVKFAFNPTYFESEMKKLADSPSFNVITDKMGVDLPGVGATQDEAFIGSGLAERIPVAGHVVQGADRAYTGILTKLRYDVANQLVDQLGGAEAFTKNMEEAYGNKQVSKTLFGLTQGKISSSDRAMQALGEVINTFTGRGGLKGGALDKHMKTASSLLFAPRLWAANLNRLNPAWYIRLARANPEAAKLALQTQGTFLTVAGTVLGLAAGTGLGVGATVGLDPRSADFGKIKVGNTRYDILGGQQQNIVALTRLVSGEKVDSQTGEVKQLGDGFGATTAADVVGNMFENKSNPLLAAGIKFLQTKAGDTGNWFADQIFRKDQYGNDYNSLLEAANLVTPLNVQGTIQSANDVGDLSDPKAWLQGGLLNAPGFVGVGVQTYGNTPTKDTIAGANVDAVQGAKNYEADLKKQQDDFKKGLNQQDQAYLSKSQNEMDELVKKGTITQDYEDGILAKKKQFDQISNPYTPPKGVTDELSSAVYKQYDTMTSKQQAAWLKDTNVDDTGKQIAATANADRVPGLEEFKPSNALSKLYADYQKKLGSNDNLTEVDKRNAAKAFQESAAKLNYNQSVQDMYSEGGSSDMKTLISDGKISKEDLDNAVKLDNELYSSGVTGSLKFSKKFRSSMGYSTPTGGGAASGGSGSGGSGSSGNAHLTDLLVSPTKTAGGSTGLPKIDTTQVAKKVSTPALPRAMVGTYTPRKRVDINL